jgi:hypothetical protein
MEDTLDNTSYAENTKTQCEWAPLIRKKLIPPLPLGPKERSWQKCQRWLPWNNINGDVNISKVGESDMLF